MTTLVNGQPESGGLAGGELSAAVYSNLDITTNLNAVGVNYPNVVGLFGTMIKESIVDFTVSGQTITCNFEGVVSVSASLHLSAAQASRQIAVSIKKNGVAIGPVDYNPGKTSQTDDVSIDVGHIFDVVDGDILSVGAEQNANNGTITLSSVGTSTFEIVRLS